MNKTEYKEASPEKKTLHDAEVRRLGRELDAWREKTYQETGSWEKVYENPKEKELSLAFRKKYNMCPECQSENTACENYDPMWHDGDVICQDCRTYVRGFDAG